MGELPAQPATLTSVELGRNGDIQLHGVTKGRPCLSTTRSENSTGRSRTQAVFDDLGIYEVIERELP